MSKNNISFYIRGSLPINIASVFKEKRSISMSSPCLQGLGMGLSLLVKKESGVERL